MQPLEGYQVEAEAGHAVALALELDDELRPRGPRPRDRPRRPERAQGGRPRDHRPDRAPARRRRGAARRRPRARGLRRRRGAGGADHLHRGRPRRRRLDDGRRPRADHRPRTRRRLRRAARWTLSSDPTRSRCWRRPESSSSGRWPSGSGSTGRSWPRRMRHAHPYADIAHRAALLYSFATLLIAVFVELCGLEHRGQPDRGLRTDLLLRQRDRDATRSTACAGTPTTSSGIRCAARAPTWGR